MLSKRIGQFNVMSQNISCQEINWRQVVLLRSQVLMAYLKDNIFVIKKRIVCKNICHQEINIDDFFFAEALKNRPE